MSLVLQPSPGEVDPQSRWVLEQKLTAFPMPKSLWLFMFGEHGQQAWNDTIWRVGGDPRKLRTPAADPETGEDGFVSRIHAYFTDESLVVVRRRDFTNPQGPTHEDFRVTHTDLEQGILRQLHVVGYDRTYKDYAHALPVDRFILSEDPNFGSVGIDQGLQEGRPHLSVNSKGTSHELGRLSLDGRHGQKLIDDVFELETRAKHARSYFSPTELGHIAGMYQVEPVPVTMAA